MSFNPTILLEPVGAFPVGDLLKFTLRSSGTVDCWNADQSVIYEKPGPYTDISAGYDHQCGVLTTGDIQCWKS